MGGFNSRQFQEMLEQAQKQAQSLREKMQQTVVEASSGGGTVTVKMNGSKQVLEVRMDPEAVKAGDVEMLQDLIMAAVNEALRRAQEMVNGEMSKLTGGLQLPGLGNLGKMF